MKTTIKSARLRMKTKTNTLPGRSAFAARHIWGTRMHNAVRTLVAVASLAVALSSTPALAQVWQASTDYSNTQGYRNWRYMTYVPSTAGNPGTYELMVYGLNYYGFDSWHYEPLYGDYIVGGFMHPSGLETARVWESPVAGTVRVTGTAAKWDPNGGDGVYVTIWKNGSLLWDATIAFDDLVGHGYDLTVDVRPGDWLIFRVNRINDQNYDSILFDPRIAVESLDSSAQTYDLAGNWSITANPNGAWTYGQMDASLNFTPFTSTVDAAYLGDFFGEQPSWDGGYPMVLGKSTETCFHDFPLDRIGGHTSNDHNTYMAVRWTAPTAGMYDIAGGAWMFREIGREDLISLYVNGTALFDDVLIPARSAGYNSGTTFGLGAAMVADGRSESDLLQISLAAGDTVTLAVRKTAGSDAGDYVGIDLTLESDTGSWIESVLRDESSYVEGLGLHLFEGPTNPARAGRRLALSHALTVAANLVARGNIEAARSELWGVSVRLDGDPSPADWMLDGPEKQSLYADIQQLIYLLGLP
jgi:hypothetical protein